MTTTTTDAAPVLRLLAWLSPAFPTGAYAWSHGVERAIEYGAVTDAADLLAWVDAVLRDGAGRSDAIFLRHAVRAGRHSSPLGTLIELALAAQPSRERLSETTGQGNAFRLAAAAWGASVLDGYPDLPYPIAVGALAGASDLDEDTVCLGFLQAFAANLISAAVRLVPLGQSDGLRVLAALEPAITQTAADTRAATLDDLGGACWRSDVFSMQHETQYTRLFRS